METWMIFFGLRKSDRIRTAAAIREMSVGIAAPATPIFKPKMLIPSAIFMEAFLSYLGIGLQPPLASLGTMCNDATQNLRTCPYQLFIPALVICLIMFGFNFIGDGLRDALDPKLKK